MPLLEIEIVGEPDGNRRDALAQDLADAAGVVLKSGPQEAWVRVRILPSERYAECGGKTPGVLPVFVRILKRLPPEGDTLRREVRELTRAVARVCGRPEAHVHVCYEPPGAGRQAFGGTLVE